jgi:hypothetical protein
MRSAMRFRHVTMHSVYNSVSCLLSVVPSRVLAIETAGRQAGVGHLEVQPSVIVGIAVFTAE